MNAHSAVTLGSWVQRHPLPGNFALAFAISWGGILTILAARGFELSALQPPEAGLILVVMLLGPSVSGLNCTALVDGRGGMVRLGARLIRWQVGVHCYVFALLTMPAILLTTLWLLSATIDPAYSPRFQWPLFAVGVIAGSFEEIGWTGLPHQGSWLVIASHSRDCRWASLGHSGPCWSISATI